MVYPYTQQNLFEYPQSYMYAPFQGVEFLQAYFANRTAAIITLRKRISAQTESLVKLGNCLTKQKLVEIEQNLQIGEVDKALADLEPYIRRFEVAKRLRSEYPVPDPTDAAPIQTHVFFYSLLIQAYAERQDIRLVNVLLKVGDLLVSVSEILELSEDRECLAILIEREVSIVEALMSKLEVSI